MGDIYLKVYSIPITRHWFVSKYCHKLIRCLPFLNSDSLVINIHNCSDHHTKKHLTYLIIQKCPLLLIEVQLYFTWWLIHYMRNVFRYYWLHPFTCLLKKDMTISSSNGCILLILNGLTILTGSFTADFNGKCRLQFLNTHLAIQQTFLHRKCFLPPSFINENVSHMAKLLVKKKYNHMSMS